MLCLFCSGCLFWLYGSATKLAEHIKRVNSNDARLKQAAETARKTLPEFVARLKHPMPGDTFAIKGRFGTTVGPEYLWLRDPKIVSGRGFKAVLDQRPIALPAVKGQILFVKSEDVYDYIIKRADGSMAGGFTEIALDPTKGQGSK